MHVIYYVHTLKVEKLLSYIMLVIMKTKNKAMWLKLKGDFLQISFSAISVNTFAFILKCCWLALHIKIPSQKMF